MGSEPLNKIKLTLLYSFQRKGKAVCETTHNTESVENLGEIFRITENENKKKLIQMSTFRKRSFIVC